MATETLPTVGQANEMAVTPGQMLQYAMEKGADLDRLGQLMDLQIKWEKEQARKAYFAAVAKFKANPPKLIKNQQVNYEIKGGGRMKYKHATLDQVTDKIAHAMGEYGLSHGFDIEQDKDGIKVTCRLSHEAGYSESVSLFAGVDNSAGKNAIQAIGSTITYLSRYSLLAVTGLATGTDDDDGHATSGRPIVEQSEERREEQPAEDAMAIESHVLHEGTIESVEYKNNGDNGGRDHGVIKVLIRTANQGTRLVTAFFFSRPPALKKEKGGIDKNEWHTLEGKSCDIAFIEKPGKDGKIYRHVETLDIVGVEVKQYADDRD